MKPAIRCVLLAVLASLVIAAPAGATVYKVIPGIDPDSTPYPPASSGAGTCPLREALAAVNAGAGAARSAAEQLARQGIAVEFVHSIFDPEDETCIHLYLADSIEAVRAVAQLAALPLERVTEALNCAGAPRDRGTGVDYGGPLRHSSK